MVLGLVASSQTYAAQAVSDLSKPASKEWLHVGGDWSNSRYSTLQQITRANVKDLKGAWVVHLGSGLGAKYSLEATPLVKDGVMYVTTGNDDVFALDAKTGALIWEHKSGLDQTISTVCCGWDNRGVALGEGKVFLGRLDGTFEALRLPNGNTLIAAGTQRRVVEVGPAGKIVWELAAKDLPDDLNLTWITSLQVLRNGNLVVGNFVRGQEGHGAHAFEVTRDKRVVWKFADHEMVKSMTMLRVLDDE